MLTAEDKRMIHGRLHYIKGELEKNERDLARTKAAVADLIERMDRAMAKEKPRRTNGHAQEPV